ncbi:MAG: SPFH domain-containing protein, partial [Sphingomonadales bacterium]|nr:SPFH domain-containing protein [Sphingomonadales bacterium]
MPATHTPINASAERRAWSTSGYLIFVAFLVLLALTVWRIVSFAGSEPADSEIFGFVVSNALSVLALIILASGFYMIQPNQAAAITLFGSYRGTDRNTGLRWVWPWMGKTKISVRANNLVSDKIKVNDLRGNPIEMAAQVVWRV